MLGPWLVVALTASTCVSAEPPATESREPLDARHRFFEREVRPLLAEHCVKCHGPKKQSGDLRLDGRASILAGGSSGPAAVPGKPEESLLIEAVRYESLEMPPDGRLSEKQVAVLTRWVREGAVWPGDVPGAERSQPLFTDEDRRWWAFQPVVKSNPPATADAWVLNDIDRFVLARLHQARLSPAPEASRAVLARRLYFDLWGLPPKPEDVAAFADDSAPDAYERLVDRLLASPHYGERWARHWLDLVRYADSDGYRIDDFRPEAWRYRDYVIQSLNDDKPYDRFVAEQLAGDELFPGNPDALVATGYLRHWIYEYNSRDVRGQWSIILNDITDTTGDVFLGLGLQCARCHNHKFDPILQKDYYRLQAFFAPLLPRGDLTAATPDDRAEHARKLAAWEKQTARIRAEIAALEAPYRQRAAEDAIEKFPPDIQAMIRKPAAQREPLEEQLAQLAYRQVTYEYNRLDRKFKGEPKERLLALRRELAAFDAQKPQPLATPLCVSDVGPLAPATVIPKKPDSPIEPGFLTILDERPAAIDPLSGSAHSTGRRAALARWLTRPDHPLTSRVMANRIWQQHFGRGLAANSSDFGRLGEKPTHPELLDWLAARLVQNGWSLKRLHRDIVTSATYRQSSDHPDAARGRLVDPENRLLWRGCVRRLEAEQIRDAVLAVAGEFDAPGPPFAVGEKRTIYTRVMRNARDPLLDAFDAPFWFASAASRDTTVTPLQSLLLINGPWMRERAGDFASQAVFLAKHSSNSADGGLQANIDSAYRLAFGRAPTASEMQAAAQFIAQQRRRIEPEVAWSAEARFVPGKIPYRDGQAARCDPESPQHGFQAAWKERGGDGDFTIEAFILPRSIYTSGEVRTIAANWNGDARQGGWRFGVTGKGSRRKPQTLVLQIYGRKLDGTFGEEAIFSDQHIQLDKPYYVAAAFARATGGRGHAVFYVKDLSNDDEPLLVAKVGHQIAGGHEEPPALAIGCMREGKRSFFDGMIDDVRLSRGALSVGQLLFTREATTSETIGYWQFEPKPGVLADSSGHGFSVQPSGRTVTLLVDVERAALADFCHVLLNSSEFLYVE